MPFILIILILASSQAVACRPATIPLEERLSSASGVYLGTVTGKTLTGLERRLLRDSQDETIVVPEEYSLRVVVIEHLKGSRKKVIEIPILDCGSGFGQLNDSVVVFSDSSGNHYITAEHGVISDARRLLSEER